MRLASIAWRGLLARPLRTALAVDAEGRNAEQLGGWTARGASAGVASG